MVGRVLVVDDIDGNIRLTRSLLEGDGHELTAARTGVEALAAVADAPPDVILLDVRMPGLDGFETCRRLKADAATRLVPVVLVTASESPADKLRGLDAGADDFISKPFNAHELRRGDAIPLTAQIVGIVDVYDAITARRPYKAAIAPAVACDELLDEARRGLQQRDLVNLFVSMVTERQLPEVPGGPGQ